MCDTRQIYNLFVATQIPKQRKIGFIELPCFIAKNTGVSQPKLPLWPQAGQVDQNDAGEQHSKERHRHYRDFSEKKIGHEIPG